MYAIVAVDERWGIGRDNRLLFHLPADLKHFKTLTSGHTVLMGRKTLQSLPGGRGLPGRRNLVLTSERTFTAENAQVVHSVEDAVRAATWNPACAIRAQKEVGSIEPGKQADILIWNAENLDYICYRLGSNLVDTVIKKGNVV